MLTKLTFVIISLYFVLSVEYILEYLLIRINILMITRCRSVDL